jgi:DNA polymerase III alpha subunit (gram-positive type)
MIAKLNLLNDNAMFILLDVETTGLDDESCHIIQLAAKVLGSDSKADIFSGTILNLLSASSCAVDIF